MTNDTTVADVTSREGIVSRGDVGGEQAPDAAKT
jgi:hypothetical protein